jgi:hypothetical protein
MSGDHELLVRWNDVKRDLALRMRYMDVHEAIRHHDQATVRRASLCGNDGFRWIHFTDAELSESGRAVLTRLRRFLTRRRCPWQRSTPAKSLLPWPGVWLFRLT